MDTLPDTPAGRQASWFLGQARAGGRDLTVEEIATHMRLQEPWTPENGLERFRNDGPIRFTSAEEISPDELTVRLVYENNPTKPWLATFRVADEPPHLITWLQMVRDVGEGVVIREAVQSEGPLLAELERRSPLTVGAVSITYDRGDDFFAFARLMEETVNLVAEENGRIVALHCVALHPVLVAGRQHRAMLLHHTRIPPEQRKKGLFSPLNVRAFQAFEGRMDAPMHTLPWTTTPPIGWVGRAAGASQPCGPAPVRDTRRTTDRAAGQAERRCAHGQDPQ